MKVFAVVKIGEIEVRGSVFTSSIEIGSKVREIKGLLREVGFTEEEVDVYFDTEEV